MKWPEVYEKNNTLYAKAMQSKEPKALMDALISSFYVDLEPRRQQDYYRLAFNKSAAEHEAYLDAEYTTMTIPQFKTSKSLGEFVKILPVKVTELLRESLLAQPRTHVFVGRDGNKYKTIGAWSAHHNARLKEWFGPSASTAGLRHARSTTLSMDPRLTVAERARIAKEMAHGLQTHLSYAQNGLEHEAEDGTFKTTRFSEKLGRYTEYQCSPVV
jgi:hypothetical protein